MSALAFTVHAPPTAARAAQMFAHNYSPLHLAAKRGHLGVCRLLLAANAGAVRRPHPHCGSARSHRSGPQLVCGKPA
jgi:ankyrin repeat protein